MGRFDLSALTPVVPRRDLDDGSLARNRHVERLFEGLSTIIRDHVILRPHFGLAVNVLEPRIGASDKSFPTFRPLVEVLGLHEPFFRIGPGKASGREIVLTVDPINIEIESLQDGLPLRRLVVGRTKDHQQRFAVLLDVARILKPVGVHPCHQLLRIRHDVGFRNFSKLDDIGKSLVFVADRELQAGSL